jgi:hypothetical protein
MKEHPILFSTPMVQAILEGRKTQTRRVVKVEMPENVTAIDRYNKTGQFTLWENRKIVKQIGECPYGQPGDRIWVRETWAKPLEDYAFKADHPTSILKQLRKGLWKPSIHMPKTAARIWLEIEEVKVERLQDISEEDAIDEGIHVKYWGGDKTQPYAYRPTVPSEELVTDYDRTPEESFQKLWQSINGGESWEANPWVWVVKFKVLSTTGKPDIHAL